MPPLVSVIIVNYNAGAYLEGCLASLEEQSLQAFEVIVVDNASEDQSLKAADKRPWVKVIRNADNCGFAAGQNQGIRLAQGGFLMPLNFDVCLAPDFLGRAMAAMQAHPQVGTISGKMLRLSPGGGLTNEFDNAGLLLTPRRTIQHRGRGESDHGQYRRSDLVFGAMGAAAVYRREMLEDIAYQDQYFDESFFTWYEDVDLDWRGRSRNWACLYTPEAVCYHVGDPHGHGRSRLGAENSIRNRWKMILANECPHCLLHHLIPMLCEELALLRHAFRNDLISTYLRALNSFVKSIPATLEKRRWVRGRALRRCLPEYPIHIRENEQ